MNIIRYPQHHKRVYRMSNRERQVVNEVCQGKCAKEIANDLHLATPTVQKHISNVKERWGAVNTPHLVAKVICKENGIMLFK